MKLQRYMFVICLLNRLYLEKWNRHKAHELVIFLIVPKINKKEYL